MTRTIRVGLIALAGFVAAVVLELLNPGSYYSDLAILGAAIAASELFELRPSDRAPLPLSFAVLVVLVRAGTSTEFVVTMAAAFLVGVALREAPIGLIERGSLLAERIVAGCAVGLTYRVLIDSAQGAPSRELVLAALAGAAVAPLVVADLIGLARGRALAPLRARGADLALATSGMLMAVGYGGLSGQGELGLWGPLFFAVPLLAAWYSFELLSSTRLSVRQTVQALGAAPELGGLVRTGHVNRVAQLVVAMGRALGLGSQEIEDLERAALLHHIGAVCLDEPADGQALSAVDVARSGASMLRASETLAAAGDIVAAEPLLHRPPTSDEPPQSALSGQILKVASAYDELTEGKAEHAAWAIEALYTGPGYVYDGRVLGALERVLDSRGADTARV